MSHKQVPYILKGYGIPEYNLIKDNDIKEYIPTLISQVNNNLEELEFNLNKKIAAGGRLGWDEVMKPLYKIHEQLRWSWGVASHLNGVRNSQELREAYALQEPEIVKFTNRLGQSKVLHKAISQLKDNPIQLLNKTKQRIIRAELLSMHQRGTSLSEEAQKKFNLISKKLAESSTRFSNNVLDATKEWSLLLTKPLEVDGLPLRALEMYASAAKEAGDLNTNSKSPTAKNGPWRVGLDMPRYIPFMTYANNRGLRETLYKAQVSRASQGELDNKPLIEEILSLRHEQAQLLGYKNWAEVSLASKMAADTTHVENLLEELRVAAMPIAQEELIAVKNF